MPEEFTLKAIIVDDETNAITNLENLINNYCPSINVISTTCDAIEGAALINELKPDVLFLDIAMPKKNGFELLNILDFIPLIVFVTAHERFAINAIKASAVDFLLKPVEISELIKVEEKLLQIHAVRMSNNNKNYSNMVANFVSMLQNKSKIRRLTLPDAHDYKIVNVDDVLYLEGYDNYTSFYLKDNKKVVVSKTLKDYEELLSDLGFFRIHKSSIINLVHLKIITKDNSINVQMSDGKMLSVSRRRSSELIERAKQFLT